LRFDGIVFAFLWFKGEAKSFALIFYPLSRGWNRLIISQISMLAKLAVLYTRLAMIAFRIGGVEFGLKLDSRTPALMLCYIGFTGTQMSTINFPF